MNERRRYTLPLHARLRRWTWPLVNWLLYKPLVLLFAIRGRYPRWMVTPDDPVSPFGSGTTPTSSTEPTQMAVYRRFGRYVGDVVWLAWRNCGFGLNYSLKPHWLKNPQIHYEDLRFDVEHDGRKKVFWLLQPDGTWLWETQRKFWLFTLITGFRIEPIYNGAQENRLRLSRGEARAARPAFHPNMDGRPILSVRSKWTM